MDFDDSPEEAAFRAEVRAWLDAHAERRESGRPSRYRNMPEPERLAAARRWQARKADAGYARVSWPREWGGRGGNPLHQVIFDEEEARYDVPLGFFGIGLGMCVPTIMKFADSVTRERFVRPALRGEQIWCQLFSEPAAGSDLAAVRTRATRCGDHWRVDGQKVWTTGAHYSDYGLLLARTDPDAPKHEGLTMFWIDMRSPGVQVQPIRQMSGNSEFNEVFLTDVHIPDNQRVGDVGVGWKVAVFTLMNERHEGAKQRGPNIDQILPVAAGVPHGAGSLLDDSAFRQRLAMWYVQAEGLRYTRLRTLTALSRGRTPGPESSIGKLVAARRLQELAERLIACHDQFGLISDPAVAPLEGSLHQDFMHAAGLRIAGGTDEILRNVIAERVLGLPGEPRVDRGVPFKALPAGR